MSPLTRRRFIKASLSTISGWDFAMEKSWKRRAIKPKNSIRFSIPIRARVTSANSHSALIRTFSQPMRDILFDEKIAGSFHFTPGQAYEEADNGNRSQVHWDMVNIQRPDYGGGEIYFDGKLIRRDGEFLLPQLRSLNRILVRLTTRSARCV